MASESAPVLSTPEEHILDVGSTGATSSRLPDEQLYVQYEIKRTVDEIRNGRFKRVALQFPDDMLVDAPRIFECLRDGLKQKRKESTQQDSTVDGVANGINDVNLEAKDQQNGHTKAPVNDTVETLTILGDTSYGACCVDEVAAEHVDADAVVHYGRSCLSPTTKLPVIYVFTTKPLDLDSCVDTFKSTYQDPDEKICLMADIPYQHHVPEVARRLRESSFTNIFATEILHDPSSALPNRTVPEDVKADQEALKEYSIFHISTPPTSLLLTLSSRVQRIHIYSNNNNNNSTSKPTSTFQISEATTTAPLRRRYALITSLSTAPTIGILINTLSVKNYLSALSHVQDLIGRAGKKSYVFVVGKVNPAKLANFAEVGGWVVIGCWESSLIDSSDFYRPIVTPFELEVALLGDESRVWGHEWISDFGTLLTRERQHVQEKQPHTDDVNAGANAAESNNWDDQPSDDEPPEFDLRTGKYVSHSRPMGRSKPSIAQTSSIIDAGHPAPAAPASSALVQRAKGDVATVNGAVSPGAEFLRSKRTWQGLGSDYEIAYERDEEGKIRGAPMEEGRSGVAKGYSVGEDSRT